MSTLQKVQEFLAALIHEQNEAFKAQIAEADRQTRTSTVVVTGKGNRAAIPAYIVDPQDKNRLIPRKKIAKTPESLPPVELKVETLPEDKALTSLINRAQALLAATNSKNNPAGIEKSLENLKTEHQELKVSRDKITAEKVRAITLEIEIDHFNLEHPKVLPRSLLALEAEIEKLRKKDVTTLSTLQTKLHLKTLAHRIDTLEEAFQEQLHKNISPPPPADAMIKAKDSQPDEKGPSDTSTPRSRA